MKKTICEKRPLYTGPTLTDRKESDMSDEVKKTPWYLQKEKYLWLAGIGILALRYFGVELPSEITDHIPPVTLGVFGMLILNTILKIAKGLIYKFIASRKSK